MSFETQIKVRFNDVDRAGIAYYPTIIGYLHLAFEDFFEEFVGVPYATVIERDDLGFPAVNVQVEFHAPLRFGDVATVAVSVTHVGRSSARFRYRILGRDRRLHAEALVTVVCVQIRQLRSLPIPEPYRGALSRAREDEDADA